MVTEPRSVHQRIIDAYRIIAKEGFTKSGQVRAGNNGYRFIPISDILAAVRRAHSEAGLYVALGKLEYDEEHGEFRGSISKTKDNPVTGAKESSKWEIAIGHVTATIYGADGDSVDMVVPFQVQDNSDKTSNKIITNIQRSLYRILYSIDEGDAEDPEASHPPMVEAKPDRFFQNATKIYRDQKVPAREGQQ